MNRFEMTFDTATEATNFFSALDYRPIPVRNTLAAHGRSDDGVAIVTFARRLYGDDIRYAFTEVPKR